MSDATHLNDTLAIKREAPLPRSFSKPYWEATRDKKLLLQYDPKVGRYQFFPRANSIATGRRNLEWREVRAKARSSALPSHGVPANRFAAMSRSSSPWSRSTKASTSWRTWWIARWRK